MFSVRLYPANLRQFMLPFCLSAYAKVPVQNLPMVKKQPPFLLLNAFKLCFLPGSIL